MVHRFPYVYIELGHKPLIGKDGLAHVAYSHGLLIL
mgnify:CR=1 FL=1